MDLHEIPDQSGLQSKTLPQNMSKKPKHRKLSVQIVSILATLHSKLILRGNLALKMIDHRPGVGNACI